MNHELEFDSLIKKLAADHQPELPSPGVIWWRAQILKKQEEKERIERPLMIMRTLAALLPLLLVLALWMSQAVGISTVFNRAGGFSFLPVLIAAFIGIGCLGLIWWKAREA